MDETEITPEQKIVHALENRDTSKVYECLVNIRKNYVKDTVQMRKLAKCGAIKTIISFLEHPKLCNISLSIIANCCLDASIRKYVLEKDGVTRLVRILKGLANDEILNRACRALGNIALCEKGLSAIHELKPVRYIVKFLASTSDVNCQQTAVRTLRILGEPIKRRNVLIRENALLEISKLLLSDNLNVLKSSIKAMAVLTSGCNSTAVLQLETEDTLLTFKKLYYHNDADIRENALTCLENLACVPAVRLKFANIGVLSIFIEVASATDSSHKNVTSAVMALCLCCREYMVRMEVKKLGGLQVLLNIIKENRCENIQCDILHALIFLCSDEACENSLLHCQLNLDVIGIITERLKIFIKMHKTEHSVSSMHSKEKSNIDLCLEKKNDETVEVQEENTETVDSNDKKTWERISKLHDSCCLGLESKDPESKQNTASSSSPCKTEVIYSIHSPTYQGLQYSETTSSVGQRSSYVSFASPLSSGPNIGSPDRYSFDWNLRSPVSCSSLLGPWSPNSCSDENPEMCWSPVLSSRSDTPDSVAADDDLHTGSDDFTTYVSGHSPDTLHKGLSNHSNCEENVNIHIRSEASIDCHIFELENEGIDACEQESFVKSTYDFSGFHDKDAQINVADLNEENLSFHNCKRLPKISSICAGDSCSSTSQSLRDISDSGSCKVGLLKTSGDSESPVSENINLSELQTIEAGKRKLANLPSDTEDSSISNSETVSKKLKMECVTEVIVLKPLESKEECQKLDYLLLLLLSHILRQLRSSSKLKIIEKADFSVLMRYLMEVPWPSPRALKILRKLISNPLTFESLIMSDFFGIMDQEMVIPHDSKLCRHCSKLKYSKNELILTGRLMAESYFGSGTLEHILVTAQPHFQLRCMYAVGRLVQRRTILYNLLINADGLNAVLEHLGNEDDSIFRSSALTLLLLCSTLTEYVKNSDGMRTSSGTACHIGHACHACCKYEQCVFDLEFKLDDNINIPAVRSNLVNKFQYFSSLLCGHYVEANQNVVSIPGITSHVFTMLMHFLHGCTESVCPFVNKMSLEDSIEMLAVCDQFLLEELKTFIEKFITCHIKIDCIAKVYSMVKMHGSGELLDSVVNYIVRCGHDENELFVHSVYELHKAYGNEFLAHIEKFIKKHFLFSCDKPKFTRRFSLK